MGHHDDEIDGATLRGTNSSERFLVTLWDKLGHNVKSMGHLRVRVIGEKIFLVTLWDNKLNQWDISQ